MTDPITVASRASAERLAADYGTDLAAEVEVALRARRIAQRPGQYIDPVSLGSLIVAIATLAWTIYTNRKKEAPDQPPEALARQISIQLTEHTQARHDDGRITNVVITEIIQAGEHVLTQRHAGSPKGHTQAGEPPGS